MPYGNKIKKYSKCAALCPLKKKKMKYLKYAAMRPLVKN